MAEGDFAGAYREIALTNGLPAVCGRVCPQETDNPPRAPPVRPCVPLSGSTLRGDALPGLCAQVLKRGN